jgi:hypothetical protein
VRGRRNLPVDRQNAAVLADEKRPALRETGRAEDAIRARRRLRGIAENRIINAKRRCEFGVDLRTVDAGCKVLDVESS